MEGTLLFCLTHCKPGFVIDGKLVKGKFFGMETSPVAPRPLPDDFRKKGWTFHLLSRRGCVALYIKTIIGENGKMIRSWEVIRPEIKRADRFLGVDVPLRETYPCDEDWGTRGWTAMSEEEAMIVLDEKALLYSSGAG